MEIERENMGNGGGNKGKRDKIEGRLEGSMET